MSVLSKRSLTHVLEVVTNVVLLLICLLVSAVYYGEWRTTRRATAEAASAAASVYHPGDRIATLPQLEFDRANHTLLLAVQSHCRFCTASMSFYKRLAARPRPATRLVVVTTDDHNAAIDYLRSHEFRPDAIVTVTNELPRIRSTPTLVLVNSKGIVERVWTGLLSTQAEREVLSALEAPAVSEH